VTFKPNGVEEWKVLLSATAFALFHKSRKGRYFIGR
jgi:hypothetical protein